MQSFPTSLLQLVVTVITHFGHAVFHVFQRISVPGAAPTNNLCQTTTKNTTGTLKSSGHSECIRHAKRSAQFAASRLTDIKVL